MGRPNVGKSTLFNQLTGTRDALVGDRPGLTRDRRYGTARRHGGRFIVVDTGGLSDDPEELTSRVGDQVRRALDEADRIVLMTDARAGRTAADDAIADRLRRLGKPIVLAVNKTDGLDERTALAEFHALGLDAPTPISAAHGRGLGTLVRALVPEGGSGPGEAGEDGAEAEAEAGGRGGNRGPRQTGAGPDRDPRPAERGEVHPRQPPPRRGPGHHPTTRRGRPATACSCPSSGAAGRSCSSTRRGSGAARASPTWSRS